MRSDEDWETIASFLPLGWQEMAYTKGALTRLRGFASPEVLLRVLLIHLAQGCSLRETAVRAARAGLADVSDVAILKRLQKAEHWLHALCQGVCASAVAPPAAVTKCSRRLLAVDATCVSEPGSTGTDWRIHYAIELPSLACPHFELTDSTGGESLGRFKFKPRDLVLVDRAYSLVPGIQGALAQGADVLVRMKLGIRNFYLTAAPPDRFDFLAAAADLRENECREWQILLGGTGNTRLPGRLCLLKRPEAMAELERTRTLAEARKKGRKVHTNTLSAASYVGLFTTLPEGTFTTAELFEIYRFRWQIELAFKRLKSLADFGHLPKHDPASCRAWLYGKLLVGLLAEKMARSDFFP